MARENHSRQTLEPELAARLGKAFTRGAEPGLLQLGAGEVEAILPPVFAYWRELGARYVTALCERPPGLTSSSLDWPWRSRVL